MDVAVDGKPAGQSEDKRIHQFCQDWARWHFSRRFFAPPPPKNLLHRMSEPPGRDMGNGGPDADLSASASYFNLALNGMPEGKQKEAFYLYYLHHVRPVKLLAEKYEMTEQGFYKMLKTFRTSVHRTYHRMLCSNHAG